MATKKGYKKEDLIEKAKTAIEENDLYFFSQVISYLPCSSATFYNHELEKVEELKQKLDDNKIATKRKLQKKWLDSPNATLQLALYKLLADEEEHKKLNQQHIDHTSKDEKIVIERKIIDEKKD
jgi:hypothetical protein